MRRHVLAVVVATAGLVSGFRAEAAQDRLQSNQRASLVGCVVQTPDGAFVLSSATPAPPAGRSSGSNSAKASTPIGQAAPSSDRPRTAGTTTPKGSTPIGVTPVSFTSSATSGSNSPKASTPVRRAATSAYALDTPSVDVAQYVGQLVEVSGVLPQQHAMKVETLRSLGYELRALTASSPRSQWPRVHGAARVSPRKHERTQTQTDRVRPVGDVEVPRGGEELLRLKRAVTTS